LELKRKLCRRCATTIGWQSITKEFQIPKQQLQELRETLIRERFFELACRQGELVPDGSIRTLTISTGTITKSVEIAYLMNWAQFDKDNLAQPARALRVWMPIHNLFQHPDAVDTRQYDQILIDAADATSNAQSAHP
jgi:hypothetical protein